VTLDELDDLLDYTPSPATGGGDLAGLAGVDVLDTFMSDRVYSLRYLTAEVEAFLIGRRELSAYLLKQVRAEERRLDNVELLRDTHGDAELPTRDLVERERFLLHKEQREEYVARWRDLVNVHTQWRVLKSSLSGMERRSRLLSDEKR